MSSLRHSVFDRLLGLPDGREPGPTRTPRTLRARRIRDYAEDLARHARRSPEPMDWIIGAIKEDLRVLLNTARPRWCEQVPLSDPIYQSLLTYGMTDFSDQTPSTLRAGDALPRSVRDAILRCEPRLVDVEVKVEPGLPTDYEIFIRIRANFIPRPRVSVPINLETVMWLSTREIDVVR